MKKTQKPKPEMIELSPEDTTEEEIKNIIDDVALELLVIKDNLSKYPDIQTTEDIFEALKVPHKAQTDALFAKLMREILTYPIEVKEQNEIPKEMLTDLFVVIPSAGLYAKMDVKDEDYQLVYQIAFLKANKYIPGKSDGMKILPFLGKKLDGSKGAEGYNGKAAWLMNVSTIKKQTSIDELKKFLMFKGTTDEFICGDNIYSIRNGSLGQHGYLNAENIEALLKGEKA